MQGAGAPVSLQRTEPPDVMRTSDNQFQNYLEREQQPSLRGAFCFVTYAAQF